MSDRCRIIHGDCLDVLRGLPDASVDAVVTDPPYGTASATKVCKRGGRGPAQRFEAFDIAWDGDLPLAWIPGAARSLRAGGSLVAFTDTKAPGLLWSALQAAGMVPLQVLFWRKTNPPPHPRKNFMSAIEAAVFARKPGPLLWWGGGGATPNVYDTPLVPGGAAGGPDTAHGRHPTQKPVDLMRWLVRLVCPPGGLVLDPFAGSGTTGVAALREGRRALLVEREAEYVAIAQRRIDEETRQGVLF